MITILTRIENLAAFPSEVRSAVCALAPNILLGYREQSKHLSKLIVLNLRHILQPDYHPVLPRSGCGHDWLDTHLLNFGAPMLYKAVERLVMMHLSAKDEEDGERIIEEFNHLVDDLQSHYDTTPALAA